MGVDFADINRAGHDDFLVTDMVSRTHAQRMVDVLGLLPITIHAGEKNELLQLKRNVLQLNRGDGTYAEIAQLSGLEASEWSWATLFLDVDLDGYEDVLVAAGYDRDFDQLLEGPVGIAERGDWTSVRLSGRALTRPPGMHLDLNGVAKSLAVDAALALLAGDGFVAAGGDVAARGGAIVGLPNGGALRVEHGGVATSGSTRRQWRRGGAPQHHLLDARTGRPSLSRWREVTVVAGSCVAADVAAKTAFLLDDDGPRWLAGQRLRGRFVDSGGIAVDTLAAFAA